MKRIAFFLPALILLSLPLLSQTAGSDPGFGIKFSGFVRSDIFFDTRQTVAARDGAFHLWPQKALFDNNGIDINARSNFNMLAILSRLTGTITGPDAFGAKTSGIIESDFFGQANDNISLVRLRIAYIKLSWDKTDLMIGQFWNPFFFTDNIPSTTSINSGTPFNSFGRNPQVRFTTRAGGFTFLAAALSQRDFASYASGGNGPASASSTYLRNAALPDLHLQIHFNHASDGDASILAGAGIAYKSIVPRLSVPTIIPAGNLEVDEHISGLSAVAFARLTTKPVVIKLYARYGENLTDMLSPGGYGVTGTTSLPGGYERTYAPLRVNSIWADMQTRGKTFQTGIFGGWLINRGTREELSGTTNSLFGNAQEIGAMFRIAPRVNFISGKTKFSFETEYTSASFGDGTYDNHGLPLNKTTVGNTRFIFTSVYSF
jgi:hypothetical protein